MSIDATLSLAISRHADLKTRAEGDVLVLPERAIRVGGSGGEILRILAREGESSAAAPHTAESVVAAMRARYPDSPEIEARVLAFLEEMLELGGIAGEPVGRA